MEISKMITISTAHLSIETAKLLDSYAKNDNRYDFGDINFPVVYMKSIYGWFVYVPQDILHQNEEKKYGNIPSDLRDCMKFAKRNCCDVLCFDNDGETVNALKTYEW